MGKVLKYELFWEKLDSPAIKTLNRHLFNVKKSVSPIFWLRDNQISMKKVSTCPVFHS